MLQQEAATVSKTEFTSLIAIVWQQQSRWLCSIFNTYCRSYQKLHDTNFSNIFLEYVVIFVGQGKKKSSLENILSCLKVHLISLKNNSRNMDITGKGGRKSWQQRLGYSKTQPSSFRRKKENHCNKEQMVLHLAMILSVKFPIDFPSCFSIFLNSSECRSRLFSFTHQICL